MFKKLILTLALCIGLYAENLSVSSGALMAHTEIFGDSQINPITRNLKGELSIENSLESIKGKIYFQTITLISDKKDRDEHMYKLLNVDKFESTSFEIKSIVKNEINYDINGVITLNGISKKITVKSDISEKNNQIYLDGKFSFNLTDFNLEPPSMLLLTVRNQIDITYKIYLKR
ncbi:YceI family protein [Aliarcobacter cibarius]|uniref:YceI family protein n=1 Tax=Aliarcobacter cibarius TaxID=255507 RepID=A0A7L5JP34_9BACT|nr:YceI family protein [Aliarcobacter cibarius]QKJ26876.1 YceI-like domain-containing periplasmic protein [Aliarcobacter cibarius]TLS96018.1 YceI family protein [Aliarcobacter cibarius]TLS96635.1 YceI family protein [Aliarcobacter cibarius]TLT03084.1 YceI family protein [Aliarcobacter cibarius]